MTATVLLPGQGPTVDLPLSRVSFKATADNAVSDLFVCEFTAEVGFTGPRPHRHRRHEELFYVLEGEFEFLVGEEVVRCHAGTFIAVPPGHVHDFRNVGSVPGRLLGIATPGDLDGYFAEIGQALQRGTLTGAWLRDLREAYDTDDVEVAW